MNGRIFFSDNPWPEGHPIEKFTWTTRVMDGCIWYDFDLHTADYNAERDPETFEDIEFPSDWEAPGVWNNFHACTMSSTYWPMEATGFLAKGRDELINGSEFEQSFVVDAIDSFDWNAPAFRIYLLGHDAVADHKIQIRKSNAPGLYDINWSGKIALAYIGEEQFKYRFSAAIRDVPPPQM